MTSSLNISARIMASVAPHEKAISNCARNPFIPAKWAHASIAAKRPLVRGDTESEVRGLTRRTNFVATLGRYLIS